MKTMPVSKRLLLSVAMLTVTGSVSLAAMAACHPSYEDECVPIASDADCAGGGGNGPAYVRGPVRVVGPDVYGLDRDGDGVGCD